MVSDSTRPAQPPRTPLATVADWAGAELRGEGSHIQVTGISLSSQRIRPGDLYAALPGTRAHGIEFAEAALASGAVAILTDPAGSDRGPRDVPHLVVDHPRALLGRLSARIYGEPAVSMRMIGVTGTQGKTTTTRLLEAGLQQAGVTAAAIGTVGTRIAGEDVRSSLTTPEAPYLHALFAVMRERGVRACAMEVSSHALVMGRVDGVVFDVAVFLNLGRDHLDFHRDLEDYYAAKASLFTPDRARLALVNIDDDHGRRLAAEATVPVRTFSIDQGASADWLVTDVRLSAVGSRFVVLAPDGRRIPAGCSLPGDFTVANTRGAVAAAGVAGLDPVGGGAGIAAAGGVPGRLERVDAGQDFLVVVDYAHKPDAVEAAIRTLRPLTEGRVIVVLGAGGDRDPGKRPIMAGLAARLADLLVVTDDNPRTEDPAAIRAAMLAGVEAGEAIEIGDRRAAIREALRQAEPGDIVLVAGKGHETGQEVDGVVHPFDDREVVREEIVACSR